MRLLFWFLWICSSIDAYLGHNFHRLPLDKLGLQKNYNEIVRDVIKNWESPIVYLQGLGYLSSDYKDTSKVKPNLDAIMSRIERDDQEAASLHSSHNNVKFGGTKDGDKLIDNLKRANRAGKQRREDTEVKSIIYPSLDDLMSMHHLTKVKTNSAPALKQQELQQKLPDPATKQQLNSAEFLKRLVQKTSPEQNVPELAKDTQQSPAAAVPNAQKNSPENTSNEISKFPRSGTDSEESTYQRTYDNLLKLIAKVEPFQSSRPDEAQPEVKEEQQVETPQYLNRDLNKNIQKNFSPLAKDAYVKKLVQIFAEKHAKHH